MFDLLFRIIYIIPTKMSGDVELTVNKAGLGDMFQHRAALYPMEKKTHCKLRFAKGSCFAYTARPGMMLLVFSSIFLTCNRSCL